LPKKNRHSRCERKKEKESGRNNENEPKGKEKSIEYRGQ
jgi:hypothetical protein